MPQYPDYFGQAALRPVPNAPQTLESVYNAYLAKKQFEAQQAQVKTQNERQMGADIINQGFPTQEVPSIMSDPSHPLRAAFDSFMAQRKRASELGTQKTEADIALSRARAETLGSATQEHPGQDGGANFFKDEETGIYYRIKPSHGKGPSEKIPLPGQAIGPGGKATFTTAGEGGKKMLSPTAITNLNEGLAVSRMLPDIKTILTQKRHLFGPVTGSIGGANPYAKDAQATQAEIRAVSQAFGRFMEGGVLRKEDEIKYEKMFPQLKDLPDVAERKLEAVDKMLSRKYASEKASIGESGYDVSGLGDVGAEERVQLVDEKTGKPRTAIYKGDKFVRWE